MKIPEGSKIIIHDLSFDTETKPVEAYTDLEIEGNEVTMLDGYLCWIDKNKPIEVLEDGTYKIRVWAQDAVCIKKGYMYQSISDTE